MLMAVALTITLGQPDAQAMLESFLKDNPEAEKLHAAYIEYMNHDNDAARAERDFVQSIDAPAGQEHLSATVIALSKNPVLAEAKNSFFEFLGTDPEARALAERIYEARDRYGLHGDQSVQGYRHLRSHLSDAADLLGDEDRGVERPPSVKALIDQLDETPGARESLRQTFKHLAAKPGAAQALSPYWQNTQSVPEMNEWESYLDSDPARWRKAFTRDVLLAKNADVREGVAKLHRIVGDDPEIAKSYLQHVRKVSTDSDAREGILRAWQERHGYRPAFPKSKRPATMNTTPRQSTQQRLPRKPSPPRATARRPQAPQAPGTPGAPRRPIARPTSPTKPTPPKAPQAGASS